MDKKTTAKKLYLHSDKTQKEIADILDVDSKTLYLWIRNGRWEEMKTAARQGPYAITQQLYNHVDAINDQIAARDTHLPEYKEVEMMRKLISTARLMDKMHVGAYIEAFQELTTFIKHKNPLILIEVTKLADEYVQAKIAQGKYHGLFEKVTEAKAAYARSEKEMAEADQREAENTPDHATAESGNTIPETPENREKSGIFEDPENILKPATVATFTQNKDQLPAKKNEPGISGIPCINTTPKPATEDRNPTAKQKMKGIMTKRHHKKR